MPKSLKPQYTGSRLLSSSKQHGKNAGRRKSKNVKTSSHKWKTISAVLTRLFFLSHTAVALWRVSLSYPFNYLYFLGIGVFCLLLETIFTVGVRKGKEYKWFCPSVFFYLLSVVPCLWLLELDHLNKFKKYAIANGGCNVTEESPTMFVYEEYSTTEEKDRTQRDLNLRLQIMSNAIVENRSKRGLANETLPANATSHNSTSDITSPPLSDASSDTNSVFTTLKLPDIQEASTSSKALKTTSTADTARDTTISNITDEKEIVTKVGNTITKFGTKAFEKVDDIPPDFRETNTNSKTLKITLPSTTLANIKSSDTIDEEEDHEIITKIGNKITEFGTNALKKVNDFFENFDSDTWMLTLHQVLLFVLVIGRWLLPKGDITRDQLSQLLLVFIGVGADILEFVTETIDNDVSAVRCNLVLHYIIYGVWSWSLMQFTLVLTASKSQKTRLGFSSHQDHATLLSNRNGCCANSIFNKADLWGIVVTMMLQDMPFLAFRLYVIIVYEQVQQMMIFFTGKNILVVCLQIYRLIVLKVENKSPEVEEVSRSELQPLRDTLQRMVSHSSDNALPTPSTVKRASFKRKNDGSVTVKLHLTDEKDHFKYPNRT